MLIKSKRRILPGALLAALSLAGLPSLRAAEAPPATLSVDAREAPRAILHARLVIPASPGAVTLLYPKWIPGEHGPTGPIADLAGLKLSAGRRAVRWERDPVDMYAIHCDVPAGASALQVSLDFLLPPFA